MLTIYFILILFSHIFIHFIARFKFITYSYKLDHNFELNNKINSQLMNIDQ